MKIRIFAHSRSGHHAFINWLINQLNGSTIFHNNCMKGWENKKLIENKKKGLIKHGKFPYKNHIYSFEYFNLNNYNKYNFNGWDGEYVDILFLRDYYNWLASSYKIKNGNEPRFINKWKNFRDEIEIPIIDLWKQYAEEYLNKEILPKETINVNYNEWFKSKNYRKNFCDKLNLSFTDKGIENVSSFGGGSSYTKLSFRKDAQKKLKTIERWKNHKIDKNFIKLIEDNKKIIELNEKIFNMKLINLYPLEIQ